MITKPTRDFHRLAALPLLLVVLPVSVLAGSHKWQNLITRDQVSGLRGWQSASLPAGWTVRAGVLSKVGVVEDLVTDRDYANFELELQWKLDKAGNSGIFYRGTRDYDFIYWSAPEYQLLDDANAPDGRNRLTSAAANYGLIAGPAGVVKPYGQWNRTRLIVNGKHVEHWLNGRRMVAYELESAEWKALVAGSKFSEYPKYGLSAAGMIGIQGDHLGSLSIRKLRVRELGGVSAGQAEHDTVQAALGNTLIVHEPSGTEVRMRFTADHRYELEYLDPAGKGAFRLVGKQVCLRAAPVDDPQCHDMKGRWWVEGSNLCQKPDGDKSDRRDCHELAFGKRVGDTWTQPAGPNATMRFELRPGK